MSAYWLTPLVPGSGAILGSERIRLQPEAEAQHFRRILTALHPRLLLSFKANLLLSDDALLACGVDELPFSLDNGEEIHFTTGDMELSHCAEAYMDRLLGIAECQSLLSLLDKDTFAEPVSSWLSLMIAWLNQGYHVMLLQEEGT
ncbi:hypothetical protein [Paenibacillus thalictri]|uniref:Uncharacterized protein n=1 Tax=Paenibacillus thalictri TaxID=2527873 RepID=A0A4Q9DS95_9BACL|nr:hypothetical protein [Paenibacillus thalictri]TBL78119.1 hypothetical protein EYB31_14635 [Paenibacillus thalictri]